MSIDIRTEQLLTLSQAARLLPPSRRGRPASLSCVLRWVLSGTKDPAGNIVRLEAVRLGPKWVTSQEALQRFADRLTPRLDEPTQKARTPTSRERAAIRAKKQLEAVGI
jgi:hypothetical protein